MLPPENASRTNVSYYLQTTSAMEEAEGCLVQPSVPAWIETLLHMAIYWEASWIMATTGSNGIFPR
jgi:hypothetical protein